MVVGRGSVIWGLDPSIDPHISVTVHGSAVGQVQRCQTGGSLCNAVTRPSELVVHGRSPSGPFYELL